MPTIFLSYRRSDTGGEAGRLTDALQNKIGKRFVFRDVVSISPGDRFDAELKTQLASAQIVLVLIGPAWLEELKKRLTEEGTDYHHLEVAMALKEGKRVIPVLLRGAALPPPRLLPEDLLKLAKCQAITILDETWRTDVDRLMKAIGSPYRLDMLTLRIVIAVIVIILAVWKLTPQLISERVGDYDFLRCLVLSLIGVYGLIELLVGYLHFRRIKRLRRTD